MRRFLTLALAAPLVSACVPPVVDPVAPPPAPVEPTEPISEPVIAGEWSGRLHSEAGIFITTHLTLDEHVAGSDACTAPTVATPRTS